MLFVIYVDSNQEKADRHRGVDARTSTTCSPGVATCGETDKTERRQPSSGGPSMALEVVHRRVTRVVEGRCADPCRSADPR